MDEEKNIPQGEKIPAILSFHEYEKTAVGRWGIKIVFLLIFLGLIQLPLFLVSNEIDNRQSRENLVTEELAKKWGGNQIVTAPLVQLKEGNFMRPETLEVKAEATPQIRYRGIYSIVLYTSQLRFTATFTGTENMASLLIKCSDLDGVTSAKVMLNGKELALQDCDESNYLSFALPAGISGEQTCNITLELKGSKSLKIIPVARRNTIDISGTWGSPSFDGKTLPLTREVQKDHFTAQWQCDHFTPQFKMVTNLGDLKDEQANGVNFMMPVSPYVQSNRLLHYATLFVSIFFFTLLLTEKIIKTQMLPLQYLVAAGAPVLFYLMVLAFSEQMGFACGYWVAAAVVTVLIAFYSHQIFDRKGTASILGLLTLAGYGLNYLLLQMEEMALFTGTIILAVMLAFLMAITGKLNRKKA